MKLDPYLGTCVADANRARPCGAATGSPRRDFCAEHVDEADDTAVRIDENAKENGVRPPLEKNRS